MNILEEVKLTIPHVHFNELIDTRISLGEDLYNKNVDSSEKFNAWDKEFEQWKRINDNILIKSFEPKFEKLHDILIRSTISDDYISFKNRDYIDEYDVKCSYLGKAIKGLTQIKKLVSALNSIINPESRSAIPEEYTTEDLIKFSLQKLAMLYDNSYYPLDIIIAGNGIQSARYEEAFEIANLLIKKGYAEKEDKYEFKDTTNIRITSKGKLFIEAKLKSKKTQVKHTKSDKEISKKLDEIMEKLRMQGFGQEILYEEIEELKEFLTKVPKKNWYEMVKGKLITLAVDQVINMDTAKGIFKDLTEHVLQLPK